MKKFLLGVLVCSLSAMAHGSSTDRHTQAVFDLLSQGEWNVMTYQLASLDVIEARNQLIMSSQGLFPKISEWWPRTQFNFVRSTNDFDVLHHLVSHTKRFPMLRPFLKKAYNNILKKYGRNDVEFKLYSVQPWFPKKNVVNAYPSSFEPGSAQAIVLGPLLSPEKITKIRYDKQVESYYRGILKSLKFVLKNRSDVLFPGLTKAIKKSVPNYCSFPTKEIKDEFYSLADAPSQKSSALSKPNEKRDLAILAAFWKASIDDEYLVAFVKQGHANFKKCYGYDAPVRSLKLEDGLTLGKYADRNKGSKVAELCYELEPASTSFFVKAAVVGILSGIGYIAYKKYKSYKSSGFQAIQ